jgi:hypothetical protein
VQLFKTIHGLFKGLNDLNDLNPTESASLRFFDLAQDNVNAARSVIAFRDCRRVLAGGRGFLYGHAAKVFIEKFQCPGPGSRIMVGLIAPPTLAIEAVRSVGIEEELMFFSQPPQFGVKRAHLIRRWILIQLAEVALNRTGNIGRQFRRRRAIVAPL